MQSVLDFAQETITGKCYVVCTSKDERNPQPSKEASDKSDYIFYRTLDAGNFTISDKTLDKIINIDVKYLLNWEADLKPNPSPGLKTIVVEGRLETNEADVLVNSSKVESLKLLEDKVKGSKFEQITNRVTKIEVTEKKHLNEGKRPEEKGFYKLKHDSANVGEMKNNGIPGHTEENLKSSKRAALSAISVEKTSKKIRPSDDSVRLSGDVPNKASTGTRKLQIDAPNEEYNNDAVKSNKEPSEKAVPVVPVNNEPKVYNKFVEVTRKPVTDGDTLSLYPKYESGGSIHKLLHEYDPFREPVIRNYTTQILARLAYLHGRNTMHRDIKGANIPVDPSGEIKLADFGMAKHMCCVVFTWALQRC